MNTDKTLIKIKKISKTFRIPKERKTQLKHYFLNPFHKPECVKFEALKNISFEVKKGEFLGIIGRNGSGKSTLLKLIAGIYQPDKGEIKVKGKITPFLELGVGFNPELSARENIFLNGTILGMTRKYLEKKFDEIVDFAEVREFIDMPVKNFSSGMQVRLAFAIAIQSDADIYLVDEVLAVGDASFQEKCFDVFRRFKKEGKTIVFVSHGMDIVQEFCDKIILIHEGEVHSERNPLKTILKYFDLNFEKPQQYNSDDADNIPRFGSGEIFINKVQFYNENKVLKHIFTDDKKILIKIHCKVRKPQENLRFGVAIFDNKTNNTIFATNTKIDNIKITKKNESFIFQYSIDNTFLTGKYDLQLGIFSNNRSKNNPIDFIDRHFSFEVKIPNQKELGQVRINHEWCI